MQKARHVDSFWLPAAVLIAATLGLLAGCRHRSSNETSKPDAVSALSKGTYSLMWPLLEYERHAVDTGDSTVFGLRVCWYEAIRPASAVTLGVALPREEVRQMFANYANVVTFSAADNTKYQPHFLPVGDFQSTSRENVRDAAFKKLGQDGLCAGSLAVGSSTIGKLLDWSRAQGGKPSKSRLLLTSAAALLCGAAVFREKIADPRTDTVVSADRVVEDSLEAYANTAFDADTRLPVDVYHALGKTIRETLERDFRAAKPNPARGRPCPKPAEVLAGAQGTAPNNGVPSSSNPPNL